MFNLSPNMQMPIPVVENEIGPNYAVDVNNSLIIIDNHTHQPGSGLYITPAAMNINSDLTFQNNRATLLYSLTFTPQTSVIPAVTPDVGALFVSGVDLYYNTINGVSVRITQNGGVVGSPGTISGLTAPASASYVSANSTFVWQSAANTPAGMDNGPITIRNITPNSFGTTISANSGIGANYTMTLPAALPTTLSVLTEDTSGNIGYANINATNPSGSIIMYGGATAPSGYLLCDGTSYLQSSYPTLFAAISTAFGSADGTHFNVPDFRGLFPRGVLGTGPGTNDPDSSTRSAYITGGNSGNAVGSYQSNQNLSHTHSDAGHTHGVPYGVTGGSTTSNTTPNLSRASAFSSDTGYANIQASGGNQSNPNNLYVNFIIKT